MILCSALRHHKELEYIKYIHIYSARTKKLCDEHVVSVPDDSAMMCMHGFCGLFFILLLPNLHMFARGFGANKNKWAQGLKRVFFVGQL